MYLVLKHKSVRKLKEKHDALRKMLKLKIRKDFKSQKSNWKLSQLILLWNVLFVKLALNKNKFLYVTYKVPAKNTKQSPEMNTIPILNAITV